MIELPKTPIELKQEWYLADLEAALEKYNKVAKVKKKLGDV